MPDLKHNVGSDVLVLRACYHHDGSDLLAIAGQDAVQVIQCTDTSVKSLAYFTIGLKVTAIAWSPRSVSPIASDDWFLELAVSTHDFHLHILTKSHNTPERMRRFGGILTGHHARVNDIAFVGGQDDNARHVATVSEDRNLLVWDLYPTTEGGIGLDESKADPDEPQPTALPIPFAYPLCSISSHPSTSKEFLVSDSRGSVFLVDWRKDPNANDEERFSHRNILELVHPKSLADAAANMPKYLYGSASWRLDDHDVVGAVFGSEYALWDIGKLKGGKPFATGTTFTEGGHRFRWCPSFPEYFAISTSATTSKGALISVNSVYHLQTQPTDIQIKPRPHRVTDFDWLGTRDIPRLAVAVGSEVLIFPISVD